MKGKGKRPSISRTKPKGKKPPAPTSMDAEVPRKLGKEELYTQSKRLVTKIETLKGLESRKRNLNRELNEDIKATREAVYEISSQLATGVEMVKQGDLFAGGETKESKVPPPAEAVKGLSEIAMRGIAPQPGSHIESVTLSMGGKSVKLTQADSPAAQFVGTLGGRNGMDDGEMKRQLWDWCADKGIRGKDAREALWLGVKEIVAKPAEGPVGEAPQATA